MKRLFVLLLLLCIGCATEPGERGEQGDVGPQGPRGLTGAPGAAGAPGHLGALKERTASKGVALDGIVTVTATCETGRVVSGGCRWGKEAGQMTAWMSTPTSDGDGWICAGVATAELTDIEALALCDEDNG